MNLPTVIVLCVLLAVLSGIVVYMRRKKKQGKGGCGCNCSECPVACSQKANTPS